MIGSNPHLRLDNKKAARRQLFVVFITHFRYYFLATKIIRNASNYSNISFTGFDKEDYVFFFEALNAENTATQFAVRVTPDMFDNAQ